MSAVSDLPVPPEIFYDQSPPLSDEHLDRYFEAVDYYVEMGDDLLGAVERLATVDDPNLPSAQRTARWRIEDERTAAWAAAKLADAERSMTELLEQRDEWMERIGLWFDQASRRYARTAGFMRGQLCDYGLRVRAEGGPATIRLPGATVKTSDRKAAVEVADDAVLARYLDAMLGEPPRVMDDDEAVAWAAWQTAWAKACEGMDEPLEVVKRTPKVYVGPLRKLVAPAEIADGTLYTVVLGCGHEVSDVARAEDEPVDMPTPAEFVVCAQCEPDPIDGQPERPVREVREEPAVRLGVLGPDGSEVPGTAVSPPQVTARVEL